MNLSRFGIAIGTAAVVVAACSGGAGQTQTPAVPATTAPVASPAETTPPAMSPSPGESMDHGSMSPAPSMSVQPSMSAEPSMGAADDVNSPASTLRTDLNYLLGEHLILAAKATGAALGGRSDQFAAYGDLLNTNGTDLGAAIGSLYGSDAEDEFNRIWSAHNGFFVDYTTGVATDDQAKQDEAVNNLTTVYVPQFSQFLAGATGLPEDAVTQLVGDHVLTTKAIVDAQAAGDAAGAATADRTAAMHMRMIGDPLAAAIVASLPDKF
jgi:hypothetical protein